MKRTSQIQQHPNQEDKTGKATYASITGVNSSTVSDKPDANDMPGGAETDFKSDSPNSKKKITHTPEQ